MLTSLMLFTLALMAIYLLIKIAIVWGETNLETPIRKDNPHVFRVPKANFKPPKFPNVPRRDTPCVVRVPKASMKNRPNPMVEPISSPQERLQLSEECYDKIREIVRENMITDSKEEDNN